MGCPTRPGPRDRRSRSRPGSLVVVVPPPASVFRPSRRRSCRHRRAGVARPAARSTALRRDGRVVADRLVLGLLLGDRRLQRAQDVVVRARVGLHVRREMLERLLVAVHRVGLVDPAVVPVVQQQLPARRCRLRGAGRTAVPTSAAATSAVTTATFRSGFTRRRGIDGRWACGRGYAGRVSLL